MTKKNLDLFYSNWLKNIKPLVFIAILSFPVYGKEQKASLLEQRIANLENYKSNLDQLYQIKVADHRAEIIKAAEEKMKDVEDTKKIITLILSIGIPSTIIGLGVVYLSAIKKSKKLIIDKIERIVEHKREELIKLIQTQEFDSKLKRIKKIVVLSPSDEANEQIKQFFSKVKFTEVRFRVINQYSPIDDFDLIVFNDYDGAFSQDVINEYLVNIPDDDVSFVAYTTKNLIRNHRINFSNSPFTLYHSILSTLKYSEILKVTES